MANINYSKDNSTIGLYPINTKPKYFCESYLKQINLIIQMKELQQKFQYHYY